MQQLGVPGCERLGNPGRCSGLTAYVRRGGGTATGALCDAAAVLLNAHAAFLPNAAGGIRQSRHHSLQTRSFTDHNLITSKHPSPAGSLAEHNMNLPLVWHLGRCAQPHHHTDKLSSFALCGGCSVLP